MTDYANIHPELAVSADIADLTALWQRAFGDEPEYTEIFVNEFFVDGYSNPVIRIDGKVVCMLTLIEVSIRESGMPFTKGAYIHAAATDTAYRSKGLMRRLMEYTIELGIARGYSALILIPANDGLFDFYANLGFKDTFYQYTAAYTADNSGRCELIDVDISDDDVWEDFYKAYVEYNSAQSLTAIKERGFFDYTMREYFCDGAMLDGVAVDGELMGYLLYRIGDDEAVQIEQYIPSNPNFDQRNLRGIFEGEIRLKCDYALAQSMGVETAATRFGMMYPLNERVKTLRGYAKQTPYIGIFGE